MKVNFDEAADALYIRLDEAKIEDTEEVSPGVVLDYDAKRRVVGIEILGAKAKLPKADLKTMQFKVA